MPRYRLTIITAMRTTRPILLHWLLIVMITISPLRAVVAGGTLCNMPDTADEAMSHPTVSRTDIAHPASQPVQAGMSHLEHAGHFVPPAGLVDDVDADDVDTDNMDAANNHSCCCCDSFGACDNQCDMGMHLTLLLQHATAQPQQLAVSHSEIISYQPVFRQPTPPSRPPSFIHS